METIIETDRIILRRFVDADFQEVYDFNSNEEVIKYTGDRLFKTIDEAKDAIKNIWKVDYKKHGYGRFAVVYKPDNKVIGFAGLKYLPEFDETDIGYRFSPEYWGKGIATEASKPWIKYGFEVLKLKQIIGFADPENIASCKVLEKLGLTFQNMIDFEGKPFKKYNIKNPNQ